MAVYVHIGLPRAASTTLQKSIFPNIKNVAYIGVGESNIPGLNMDSTLFSGLWKSDEKEFDSVYSKWSSTLDYAMKYANSMEKDVVVSFEGWCRPSQKVELSEVANRISLVFRKPTIIFLLRNPKDWIESCYAKVVWNQFRTRDVSDPIDISTINKYYDLVRVDEGRFFGICGIEPQRIIKAFSAMDQVIIPAEHLIKNNFETISEINDRWHVSKIEIEKHNKRHGKIAMSLARAWFRFPPFLRRFSREWIIRVAPKVDEILKISDKCRVSKRIKKMIQVNYDLSDYKVKESTKEKLKSYRYFDIN